MCILSNQKVKYSIFCKVLIMACLSSKRVSIGTVVKWRTSAVKRVKVVNNHIIAQDKDGLYSVFTKDEYAYGEGYRTPEHDGMETIAEAEEKARGL